jgi:hypothetical protein
MAFEKGHTINVGRRLSQSTRKRMSKSHGGIKPSDWGAGFKPGNKSWQTIMQQNAYFAGLVDGEGSIYTTFNGAKRPGQINYKKVCVVITMKADKAQPLPEGKTTWGGSLNIRPPRKSNQHEALDWRMSGKTAEGFLKSIFPYLRIKQRQAKLALEYIDHQHKCMGKKMTDEVLTYRKNIENQIRSLNH